MKKILLFLDVLSNKLWKDGKTVKGNCVSNSVARSRDKIMEDVIPIGRGDFNKVIYQKIRKRLVLDNPLFLPPLDEDDEFVPALTMDWKLNSEWPDISLKVEMYRHFKEGEFLVLKSLGFRFEQEKPNTKHCYIHVQINKERATNNPLLGCPIWIPGHIPCIPIIARCPVSLILCLLVSFYGIDITRELNAADIKIDSKYWKPLVPILREMTSLGSAS